MVKLLCILVEHLSYPHKRGGGSAPFAVSSSTAPTVASRKSLLSGRDLLFFIPGVFTPQGTSLAFHQQVHTNCVEFLFGIIPD